MATAAASSYLPLLPGHLPSSVGTYPRGAEWGQTRDTAPIKHTGAEEPMKRNRERVPLPQHPLAVPFMPTPPPTPAAPTAFSQG